MEHTSTTLFQVEWKKMNTQNHKCHKRTHTHTPHNLSWLSVAYCSIEKLKLIQHPFDRPQKQQQRKRQQNIGYESQNKITTIFNRCLRKLFINSSFNRTAR